MHRLVLAVALLASCKKGSADAPPCGAVAAKFLVIAQADLARAQAAHVDEASRRAVLDQLPAMRDSLAYACTETGWTAAVRKCLVDAADHTAFEACQRDLTEPQRAALAKSATGKPSDR